MNAIGKCNLQQITRLALYLKTDDTGVETIANVLEENNFSELTHFSIGIGRKKGIRNPSMTELATKISKAKFERLTNLVVMFDDPDNQQNEIIPILNQLRLHSFRQLKQLYLKFRGVPHPETAVFLIFHHILPSIRSQQLTHLFLSIPRNKPLRRLNDLISALESDRLQQLTHLSLWNESRHIATCIENNRAETLEKFVQQAKKHFSE